MSKPIVSSYNAHSMHVSRSKAKCRIECKISLHALTIGSILLLAFTL